jgi:hypothetical protein
MKIVLTALAFLALPLSVSAMAQQPDWSQQGDYYAPGNSAVQQLTPKEQDLVKEGDYYAPSKTTVQHPNPEELKQDREGDYYAPLKSK